MLKKLFATVSVLAVLIGVQSLAGCATAPSGPGWVTLIDGENGLQNWNRTGDGNWRATGGVIQIDGKTNKEAAFLYSKESYQDFELYVEWWADEAANSGVFYRITNTRTINTKGGYEVQIFDKTEAFPTGSLVNVAKAVSSFKAAGQWHTFLITVKGPRMIVKMDGETAVEVNNSNFPAGPIGLQYNAGTVKFRKVMIKPL